jgi:hypothetical protein
MQNMMDVSGFRQGIRNKRLSKSRRLPCPTVGVGVSNNFQLVDEIAISHSETRVFVCSKLLSGKFTDVTSLNGMLVPVTRNLNS